MTTLRIARDGIERDMTAEEAAQFLATLPGIQWPPVPGEITNFQARALLMQMPGSVQGRTLFSDADDALRALGGVAWQAWEYTTVFPRNSELIATMAAQFNLSEAQVDQMFIAASQISA